MSATVKSATSESLTQFYHLGHEDANVTGDVNLMGALTAKEISGSHLPEKVPNEYRLDCDDSASDVLTHFYQLGYEEASAGGVRQEKHLTAFQCDDQPQVSQATIGTSNQNQHGGHDAFDMPLESGLSEEADVEKGQYFAENGPNEYRLDCDDAASDVLTHFYQLGHDKANFGGVCPEKHTMDIQNDDESPISLSTNGTTNEESQDGSEALGVSFIDSDLSEESDAVEGNLQRRTSARTNCSPSRTWSRSPSADVQMRTPRTVRYSSASSSSSSPFFSAGSSLSTSANSLREDPTQLKTEDEDKDADKYEDDDAYEASMWGEVFVTRIQTRFRQRAQRRKQSNASQPCRPSFFEGMIQLFDCATCFSHRSKRVIADGRVLMTKN